MGIMCTDDLRTQVQSFHVQLFKTYDGIIRYNYIYPVKNITAVYNSKYRALFPL